MESNQTPSPQKGKVIAIDGPAGAGKSTVAKRIAKALQFSYLDTGAMYRALTLKALRLGIHLEREEDLVQLAKKTNIDLEDNPEGIRVFLDKEDVSEKIRTQEVTNNTFYIARAPAVREIMVQWQRAIGEKKSVVIEGRDVTTVVFPDATNKFYLDADVGERSRRRFQELKENGQDVEQGNLIEEIRERDHKDTTRPIGALKKADDAFYLDTSQLSIDEVVDTMLKVINNDG